MNTKRKTGISVAYDTAASTITWTNVAQPEDRLVLNVASLPENIRNDALWHGLDQKVTDAGAIPFGAHDGKDKPERYATVAEKLARMRRVAEGLMAGNWTSRAAADPLAGKSEAEIRALIAAATAKLAGLGV
jgi:hypothetical protein